MTTRFTPSTSKNYVLTPEDMGAVGFTTEQGAIDAGIDNTASMQQLADVVWQRRERAYVPPLFYRCNSQVNVQAWGEFVMDGTIVTPNTDITAIRVYGTSQVPTSTQSHTRVSVKNWMTLSGTNPLWLGKTYPPQFDNNLSVRVASLPVWNPSLYYRMGNEVTVTGIPNTAYRSKTTNINLQPNLNPTDWSSFSLDTIDGGSQTMQQRLAAETNIGVWVDSMFERSVEIISNGYAIPVLIKPSTTLFGTQAIAWCDFYVIAQSGKAQLVLMSDGPTHWINQNKFRIKNMLVSNSLATAGKGLYGVVLMNKDSGNGNYWPNGNEFTGVDMEHFPYLDCSEFVNILIQKGFHNGFENVRSDTPGVTTIKLFRHASESDCPANNEVRAAVRIHAFGVHSNGYENNIIESGKQDILSAELLRNDLGERLVYSGNDLAMIRGVGFYTGTAMARFDLSQYCYKLPQTNRIRAINYPIACVIYPGLRQWNSFWNFAIRGRDGRCGFFCYNAAGANITSATPTAPLIQSATSVFTATTLAGHPCLINQDTFDDQDIYKQNFNNFRITFHEQVHRAIFFIYTNVAGELDGFEIRCFNSAGAKVTNSPGEQLPFVGHHTEQNVVRAHPQKGSYTRPWAAMYEQSPGAGIQWCYLDTGTTAFPSSWATSGSWTSGQAVTARDEKHVAAGSDYRIYRAATSHTTSGSAPTHTTIGQVVDNWEFMGTAEQLAVFSDG
jgi:hypothetical protein